MMFNMRPISACPASSAKRRAYILPRRCRTFAPWNARRIPARSRPALTRRCARRRPAEERHAAGADRPRARHRDRLGCSRAASRIAEHGDENDFDFADERPDRGHAACAAARRSQAQPVRSPAAHHHVTTAFPPAIAAGRSSSATTRTTSTRCCRATLSTRARCSRPCRIGIPARTAAWIVLRPEDRDAAAQGAQNVAIKRHTFRSAGRSGSRSISPSSPRRRNSSSAKPTCARSASCSICRSATRTHGGERVMPHLRFLNALDGEHVQKWQFKRRTTELSRSATPTRPSATIIWRRKAGRTCPEAQQRLCYNEIPTKVNWTLSALRLRPGDDEGDWTSAATTATSTCRASTRSAFPAMKNLWCMLNFCLFAETDTDKRAFLYVDSVCISGDF